MLDPRRLSMVVLVAGLVSPVRAEEGPPIWAYPIAPKDYVPPKDDGSIRRVPDSSAGFTLTEIRDLFVARDWLPSGHAPMPGVVATGRRPELRPCGVCHRPEGVGGPENASLAGLPAAYMMRQIADYRSGARSTGVKERAHVFRMIAGLKQAEEAELREAVDYYAAMRLPARIRVVETTTVPANYVPNWYFTQKGNGETEPLGERIVEMPDDEERFVDRDARVTFTAHVPPGSVERGRGLATGGDGDRIPACGGCHGERLEGMGDVPPLAGRSPSYVVRQLWEFRQGLRNGTMADPMRAVTGAMTTADMIAVAAYAASLTP